MMAEMGAPTALRVLTVEDDPDVQDNLRDILEMDGHFVEVATSIREVAAHEDLARFDVILLDRRLRDGSGDDLLPHLRKRAPQTAVILVTGFADLEVAVKALRHGAADLLLKPIDPQALRFRLSRIAEQRGIRMELAEAQRKLVQNERLAAIGQTLTVLSHEARNELNTLSMALRLLPNILDDRERALKIIDVLKRGENRLHRLFEDVRGFAGPIVLQQTNCDPSDVWRRAWASLEPAWQHRDVSFREEHCDACLTLPADAFRLEQVFRNLFENSLAACEDPVSIYVGCLQTESGQSLSLTVRDNGPGLSPEQRQKVFDAFFTTKTKGTGLGMAIVKRIIEAHGGSICLNAQAARGAEFVITLPVVDREPAAPPDRSAGVCV